MVSPTRLVDSPALDVLPEPGVLEAPSAMQNMEAWLDFTPHQSDRIILANFAHFTRFVRQAEAYAERGRYAMAAAYAETAVKFATRHHPGLFASPEVERLLERIGYAVVPPWAGEPRPNRPRTVEHVMHVCTYVRRIGGLTRLVWRWMQQDRARRHSLVLTRQSWREIPEPLRDAVRASGGSIHFVNRLPGSVLVQARRLAAIARSADAIVLHVNSDDVVPSIALARGRRHMPVLLVDHADHWPWVGASTSSLVVSLRESGRRLASRRRGVEPRRLALLPTPLEPVARTRSRGEAKRRLGLPEESLVLLSIAREDRYRTVNGISFVDAHLGLLARHPRAALVIVGPGLRPEWAGAVSRMEGRLVVHGQRDDTRPFFEAADVYIDSFPFTSITSLLEAGLHGLPLVALCPYSDDSAIFGPDMPGLSGTMIRTSSCPEYTAHLTRLLEDEPYRQRLGDATRRQILAHHTGAGWQRRLEETYGRALQLSAPEVLTGTARAELHLGEPDALAPQVFGQGWGPDSVLQSKLRMMPLRPRLGHWVRHARKLGLARHIALGGAKNLVPEWLALALRYRPTGGI